MNETDAAETSNHADIDGTPERNSPMATVDAASPTTDDPVNHTVHDWSAFYDPSGRLYYYNNATGESSWDEPEKFNPPPAEAPDVLDDGQKTDSVEEAKGDQDQHDTSAATAASPAAKEAEPSGTWTVHHDDEGREYYYNEVTGETQWEKPDSLDKEPTRPPSQQQPQSPAETPIATDADMPQSAVEGEETQEELQEEEVDPEVKKLEDAEKALNEPDAVMEPTCWSNVLTVVESLGQAEGGKKAMQALVASFHGETAVCGLLTRWLAELRTVSSPDSSSNSTQQGEVSPRAADSTREIVQDVMIRIAKERFTKTGGDNILNLDKKSASFLEDMMDSSRWRKLLIDLSATNKDSALLMYCLESISKRGHHREIARRINQSDHFAVYNAMLASEFAVIGKAAVSACDEGDLTTGVDGLVADLKRACTSTSYTYLYAIEVLRELISLSKKTKSSDGVESPRIHRATRKWERLKEELENAMVDPSLASDGSSPLSRKRRLDVALAVSDLYQQQRRRRKPSPDDLSLDKTNGNGKYSESLESALLNLLRRNYLGTRLEDRLLDQMLQKETSVGASGEIGRLLVSHPLTIKILLGHLFKPGSGRVASVQTQQKCAGLVALAVIAAENIAKKDMERQKMDSLEQSNDSDEVTITEMILSGSQLCSQVENMVSFTVSEDPVEAGEDSSAGRKLSTLAMRSAAVAQGVIMWAMEVARGPEFATSASYPTLTPSMLSLMRLICLRHPFTRTSILEVTFVFLKHSNSDISYQKMNEIKEQSLRLLLLLLVKGEVTSVLGGISQRIGQQGNSEFDASLLRYFINGLLDILRPPYSLPLVRSLGQMLSAPRCVEALKSSYFGQPNKQRLTSVINDFKDTISGRNTGLTKCSALDSTLVDSLVSTYK